MQQRVTASRTALRPGWKDPAHLHALPPQLLKLPFYLFGIQGKAHGTLLLYDTAPLLVIVSSRHGHTLPLHRTSEQRADLGFHRTTIVHRLYANSCCRLAVVQTAWAEARPSLRPAPHPQPALVAWT